MWRSLNKKSLSDAEDNLYGISLSFILMAELLLVLLSIELLMILLAVNLLIDN
eukprot:m.52334 g.52334  ORF g.52334 m.52334 type:complete len:53 (-) comp12692_c2_seq1:524-682(-)